MFQGTDCLPEPAAPGGKFLRRLLRIIRQGSRPLAWNEAERRKLDNGVWIPWQIIGTAVSTSVALSGQPHGNTLEYRIIAINSAGESLPSNTVIFLRRRFQ
ncbi:hypothetical protein [Candidatus Electronema sp. PJ]|uniref:hypothetical protein n=1 Tax=Candidatus Electronema sp. PJ TaxID=3401572 RepID=UPI003AA850BF